MPNVDVVRAMFGHYLNQDRQAAWQLIADDFVFTSPQDDHIGKAEYFAKCFPTVERLASQELLRVVADEADGVFVLYEYLLKTGRRHRNVEYITVRQGQISEVQVYFGGRFPQLGDA